MFTPFFVGVDVAKHTLEACKLVDGKHRCRKFDNSPFGFRSLLNWIQESSHEQPVHLAMEATGRYHLALAHFAWANQLHVYVLNPQRLKHYAKSQPRRPKTDREDAKMMADYVSKHLEQLHAYEPPREAVATLRELVRRREQLIKMLKQERNRICELDEQHPIYSSLSKMIDILGQERDEIDAKIDTLIQQDQELAESYKRLRTIPQVGRVLAMSVLAEMGDGKAFEKAKDVTAWLGLAPMVRESGKSVSFKPRISFGNHIMRKGLYMSALGAMKNGNWEDWLEPHRARGKSGHVLMVALMDKIARTCWGVLKNQSDFNPKLAFSA